MYSPAYTCALSYFSFASWVSNFHKIIFIFTCMVHSQGDGHAEGFASLNVKFKKHAGLTITCPSDVIFLDHDPQLPHRTLHRELLCVGGGMVRGRSIPCECVRLPPSRACVHYKVSDHPLPTFRQARDHWYSFVDKPRSKPWGCKMLSYNDKASWKIIYIVRCLLAVGQFLEYT